MKKNIYILIFLFMICNSISASYVRTFLPKLIEKANVIVYGKIISVDSTTFKIIAIKKIRSLSKSDTLTIEQFSNWTCASRYSEYKKDQEALFFLTSDSDNLLHIIGAGNEGELIIKSGISYVPDYDQKKYPIKKVDFISEYAKFICIDVETVLKGITLFIEHKENIYNELHPNTDGTLVYQYSYIEKLPKNDFLLIIIDQVS